MTSADFMNYAKMFGYEINFTGIGMGYITLNGLKLTETLDINDIRPMMAQIGMAIMVDTLRNEEY